MSLPDNDSMVDLLKTIMGHPQVDQDLKDQASDLLMKLAPEQHPSRRSFSDVLGDIFGAGWMQ